MQTFRDSIFPATPAPSSRGLNVLASLCIVACVLATIVAAYYFAHTKNTITTVSPTYLGPQCQGLSKAIVHRQLSFSYVTAGPSYQTLTCQYEYEVQMNSDCFALEIENVTLAYFPPQSLVSYCNESGTYTQLYGVGSGNNVIPGASYANSMTCTTTGYTTNVCTVNASAEAVVILGQYLFTGTAFQYIVTPLTLPGMTVDCKNEVIPSTSLFLCSSDLTLRWDSVVAQTFGLTSLVFTIATFISRQLFSCCCSETKKGDIAMT